MNVASGRLEIFILVLRNKGDAGLREWLKIFPVEGFLILGVSQAVLGQVWGLVALERLVLSEAHFFISDANCYSERNRFRKMR